MNIIMEGKYQTRGGLFPSAPVRLLCLDGPRSVYPVVGIVARKGEREICEWTVSGLWLRGGPEGEDDLISVTTKHPGYIIISRDFVPRRIFSQIVYRMHQQAEDARLAAVYPQDWIVVPIEWED